MMFIYAKAYVMFTEIAVTGGRPGLHECRTPRGGPWNEKGAREGGSAQEWAAIPPQTRPKRPPPRGRLHIEWGLLMTRVSPPKTGRHPIDTRAAARSPESGISRGGGGPSDRPRAAPTRIPNPPKPTPKPAPPAADSHVERMGAV